MDPRFIKSSLASPAASDGRIYGKLGSVSLNDILQLLGMSHRTATIRLENGGREGRIYFREGVLLHATAGSSTGEKALLKLINWDGAEFVVEDGIEGDPPATISKNVDVAMLNLLTRLDEGWVPELTPFPQLDRLTASAAVLDRKPGIPARRRPPLPRARARVQTKTIAFAGGAVALVAASSFAAYFSMTSLGEPPTISSVSTATATATATTAAPVAPASGIAGDILEAAVNGQRLDVPTLLGAHGLTLSAVADSKGRVDEPTATRSQDSAGPIAEPARRTVGSGHLLVVADPWALVAVDGVEIGETPLTEIPLGEGSHDVVLSNPNVVGVIRDRVEVVAGKTIHRNYSFHNSGSLRVVVKPWADVFVDGRHIGQTPMGEMQLPPGRHTVLFRHPQLGEKTELIEIVVNKERLVEVEM